MNELKKYKGEKKGIVTAFKAISVIILMLLQIAFLFFLFSNTTRFSHLTKIIFEVLKIITVLFILYRHDSAAYKISWIILIMFIPAVGIVIYLLWGNNKLRRKKELVYRRVRVDTEENLIENFELENEIKNQDIYKYNQIKYMTNITGYPLCRNEGVKYFETGEKFFKDVKEELKNAKSYILLEFYILSKGKLLDDILDILIEKAKQGVKVIFLIDSLGALLRKPKGFIENMKKNGILVYEFNPFSPVINGYINYRDHRKIISIDGKIAYTGGVNIADEYANIIEKYGYWKDVGVKVTGDVAWSFTLMTLRTIESIDKKRIDYEWYKKIAEEQTKDLSKKDGYVLAYADGPDNRKNPIESVFIQTINYAKKYLYITTPYFIISEPILTALLNSARSGVDVRVILPHIPDKKMVQMVTRSYYEVLLEAGVKVYEYKPGFVHSKTFVADDDTAIIGTANLDFRSTHLNFECSLYTYKTGEELKVKQDFESMLDKCIEVNLEEIKNRPLLVKATEAFLSAFSPML